MNTINKQSEGQLPFRTTEQCQLQISSKFRVADCKVNTASSTSNTRVKEPKKTKFHDLWTSVNLIPDTVFWMGKETGCLRVTCCILNIDDSSRYNKLSNNKLRNGNYVISLCKYLFLFQSYIRSRTLTTPMFVTGILVLANTDTVKPGDTDKGIYITRIARQLLLRKSCVACIPLSVCRLCWEDKKRQRPLYKVIVLEVYEKQWKSG